MSGLKRMWFHIRNYLSCLLGFHDWDNKILVIRDMDNRVLNLSYCKRCEKVDMDQLM